MTRFTWLALTATLLLSGAAPARADDAMTAELGARISAAGNAFQQACSESESESGEEWEFRHFFLTLAPSASFGLSGVLDLEITPELTLIWEKSPVERD